MEYVGGGDLSQRLKICKSSHQYLKEETIWKYFIQNLQGLYSLHALNIVHRDIKAANIFLSKDFKTVKIGDMNCAKVIKNCFTSTKIGTPYYLAPEIWNNEMYDFRCDVFSLGCVCRFVIISIRNVLFEASLSRSYHSGTFKENQKGFYIAYSSALFCGLD